MAHIEGIKKALAAMQLTINSTVFAEYETRAKTELNEQLNEIKKIVVIMEDELKEDAAHTTKQIIEKSATLEDIYYNRGRLVQIKKIIR